MVKSPATVNSHPVPPPKKKNEEEDEKKVEEQEKGSWLPEKANTRLE